MKKQLLTGLAAGFLLVGIAGVASAATITYDPSDILMNATNVSVNHVFNITESPYLFHPGNIGDVGVDTLTSAQLQIWTYDNGDNPAEMYKLTIDLVLQSGTYTAALSDSTVSAVTTDITAIADLQHDGLLDITVNRQNGDFLLDKEVLNFEFTQYTAPLMDPGTDPVPEPATMLLFGTGIAGLSVTRLRRKKAV